MRIFPLFLLPLFAFGQTTVVTTLPATCPSVGILYELTDSGSANGLYHCPVQGSAPVAGAGTPGPAGPTGATGPAGPTGPQGPPGTGSGGPLPPSVASSTWINQASAIATTVNGVENISDAISEEGLHLLCQPAPATPYTITVQIRYLMQEITNKYPFVAFGFSDGTKIEPINVYNNAGTGLTAGQYLDVEQWTNATTSGSALAAPIPMLGPIVALQVTDDGTSKVWFYSGDGVIFTTLATEARTTFLTATKVCWGLRTNAAAQKVSNTLLAWAQN